MGRPRALLPAILSAVGLGLSGGTGLAFVFLMVKMNWLTVPNEAALVFEGTAGEVLGISAWLIITSRMARRRTR